MSGGVDTPFYTALLKLKFLYKIQENENLKKRKSKKNKKMK